MFKIKSTSPLVIAVSLLGYANSGLALEIIANKNMYKISNAGDHIPALKALGGNPDDWACTYDANNGLIWEIKTTDGGLRDIKWNYSWLMTDPQLNGGFAGVANGGNCLGGQGCDTESYVRQVNAQGLCGANDWRMPTIEELNTLSFNQGWFVQNAQNTDKTKGFWSSSPVVRGDRGGQEAAPERAKLRLPRGGYNGWLGEDGHKSDSHGVMLVRNSNAKPISLHNFSETLVYKEDPSETWAFESPESIHLAPDETLLVADSFNHRIVNLKQDGTIIRSFGHFTDSKDPNSDFVRQKSPSSIMLATDGTLFAQDPGKQRIQHFKMDGTLISESAPEGYPVEGEGGGRREAVAADGTSFVISDEGTVQHLKANGEIIWEKQYSVMSTSQYGPRSHVDSITLGLDGTLFVKSNSSYSGTSSFTYSTYIYEHFKADGTLIGTSWSQSCSLGSTLTCGTIDMFASTHATTKEGIRFSIDLYPGRIRKYIPKSPNYIYTGATGIALFENITVGNEHYWVQLQNQGEAQFKVLKAYPIKPAAENNTSVYNPFTGLVILPKVSADGVDYKVVMERLGNGLFGVKAAEPLPK